LVSVEAERLPELAGEMLVSLATQTTAGRREHTARWRAQWRVDGDKLELQSLRGLGCEEIASPLPDGWFADCSQALLGKLPHAPEQFRRGNPYWRARLQKSFDQFVYGHRGLAIGDPNGDGLDDVYLCEEGGLPNRLLLQRPDGTVEDASAASGADFMELTRSALFLDLDEDADEDLVLTTPHGLLMLENNGAARFSQRTLLPMVGDCYSLAAADFDGNGFTDLYACVYQPRQADPARLPFPAPFYDARNGGANFLIANQGRWKFTNATAAAGLDQGNDRFSFAAMWTDFDRDGWQDLAVVNDFGKNNFYRQTRGAAGPQFEDISASIGLGHGAFGMSITGGDANRDGWLDFYTGNMFSSAGHRIVGQPKFKPGLDAAVAGQFWQLARGNALMINRSGSYREESEAAGVAMGRWSWGCCFADLNNDGWEDLLAGNGNITGHLDSPDL
jgi:FG-GAP-like repeat